MLAFTSAIAIGSGILFGLAPAFAAFRHNLASPMRQNARGSTGDGKSRLRYGLVAAEVALTLIVLAGAGVMLVSVARLLGVASRARSEERAGDGDLAAAEGAVLRAAGQPAVLRGADA